VQRIAVSISSQKPVASSQKLGERYELLVDGRRAGWCSPTSSPAPQNWGTGPQKQICTVLWTLRPGRHRLAAVVEACDCGRMANNADCGRGSAAPLSPRAGTAAVGALAPQCPSSALPASGVPAQSQVHSGRRRRAIWITVVKADG
jgi:hypothetical protein